MPSIDLAHLMKLSRVIAELTAPNYAMDLEIIRALAPSIIVQRRNNTDTGNIDHTFRKPTTDEADALFLLRLHFPHAFYNLSCGRDRPSEPLFGAILFTPDSTGTEIGVGETDTNLAIAIVLATMDALICEGAKAPEGRMQ